MSKKLTDFRPQSKNVNQHSLHGTRLLEESVQRDGWISAMTAATDGEIFDGSNRINIAAEKFVDKDGNEVEPIIVHTTGDRPVIVVRDDIPSATDPRAKRLSVAANQITATDWNPDGELLKEWGAEDEAIKKLFAESEWTEITGEEKPVQDAEPQTDRAAELLEKWRVKTGDLFAIGEHRLICGDCTNAEVVARVMGEEQADFSFTDPPYNVGIKYGKETNDNQGKQEFIDWCRGWTPHMPKRHLLTVGIKRLCWWDDILGDPQWIIAWVKRNGQGQTGLGGTNKWDAILVYGVKQDHKIDMIELNNDYSEGIKAEGAHPTAKPVLLWQDVINRFDGWVIYEPFSGSGTTLVACQNLGRKCRAIEISPAYVAVALERMLQAFPGIEIRRLE